MQWIRSKGIELQSFQVFLHNPKTLYIVLEYITQCVCNPRVRWYAHVTFKVVASWFFFFEYLVINAFSNLISVSISKKFSFLNWKKKSFIGILSQQKSSLLAAKNRIFHFLNHISITSLNTQLVLQKRFKKALEDLCQKYRRSNKSAENLKGI